MAVGSSRDRRGSKGGRDYPRPRPTGAAAFEHGGLRRGDEVVERVVLMEVGESHTGGRTRRLFGEDDGELLEAKFGGGHVRSGQGKEELVTTEAGDHVVGPQGGPQGGGDLAQDLVPGPRAPVVVHHLHPVDVEVSEDEALRHCAGIDRSRVRERRTRPGG